MTGVNCEQKFVPISNQVACFVKTDPRHTYAAYILYIMQWRHKCFFKIMGYYNSYRPYNKKKSYKGKGRKKNWKKTSGVSGGRKKWKHSNNEVLHFFTMKNTMGF